MTETPLDPQQPEAEVPFNSPEGLANAYNLPLPYTQKLYEVLYGKPNGDETIKATQEAEHRILQTKFEELVLPLSQFLVHLVPEGAQAIQFVHPGCANKGAEESWAAALAGLHNDGTPDIEVTSYGIDPNEGAIEASIQEAKNLHALGLTDNLQAHFITGGAENPDLLGLLDRQKPLIVVMRHPEHSKGREYINRGFDYQHVFDTWAQAVMDFTKRGIFAIFVTTDPESTRSQDYATSFEQMERARAKADPTNSLTVLSNHNPSATRNTLGQNDGSLTILMPTALVEQLAQEHSAA